MSCCKPQRPVQNFIVNCTPNCPDVQDISISNVNVEGEGLFFQKSGTDFQFYGIMNTDGYITVTLDADNKAVSIDIDPDLISGSIPDATTAVKGKVALATNIEAQAQSSTTKVITPSNLAALNASTTVTGLVELATSPETVTGTDTNRATTPAGVKAALDAVKAVQVVADSTERGTATPAFVGQLLFQTNTGQYYSGSALSSGSWVGPFLLLDSTNITALQNNSGLNLNGFNFSFQGGSGGATVTFYPNVVFESSEVGFVSSGKPLIDGSSQNSALLGTTSGGYFTAHLIQNFLNNSSVEEYVPSNFTPTRTFDAGTVTTEQLADVVATLIQDFSDMKIPTIPA